MLASVVKSQNPGEFQHLDSRSKKSDCAPALLHLKRKTVRPEDESGRAVMRLTPGVSLGKPRIRIAAGGCRTLLHVPALLQMSRT
ncbi:hypothetical protein AVEN_234349-1 [Araneus ventricosus]|uniref:Uncharacterized protein n=1 Tax=Araneus ventricosus TaxID=182803 RepID=A0A4Y2A904_ARAVE|nr:hypothetical protein AVEN_234349-1 [Araneus ventricosus]